MSGKQSRASDRKRTEEYREYQQQREKMARGYTDDQGKEKRHQPQLQDENQDCTVKVRCGYDFDHDVFVTDIFCFQHGIEEHLHIVIDEDGNELKREWRPNPKKSNKSRKHSK